MEVKEFQACEEESSIEIDAKNDAKSDVYKNSDKPEKMLLLKLLSEWKGRYKVLNGILKIIYNVIFIVMGIVLVIVGFMIAFFLSALIKLELLGNIIMAGTFLFFVSLVALSSAINMVMPLFAERSFLKYLKSKKITVSQIFAEDEKYLRENAHIVNSNKKAAQGIKFAHMLDYYDRNKSAFILRIIGRIIFVIEYFLFASAVIVAFTLLKIFGYALPFELNNIMLAVLFAAVMFIHMIIINSIIKFMNKSTQNKRTEWYKANDMHIYNFIEKFNISNLNDLKKDPRDF